jgi:hypothetical protein
MKNGTETDVDCGGNCTTVSKMTGNRCGVGKQCLTTNDCACLSQACAVGSSCVEATCIKGVCTDPCHDGFQDFAETDIDCGRMQWDLICCCSDPVCFSDEQCPPCDDGKHCMHDSDCQSGACNNSKNGVGCPSIGVCVAIQPDLGMTD